MRKLEVIKQKFVLYHYDKKNMNKVEDMHTVIRFLQKLRGSAHEKLLNTGTNFSRDFHKNYFILCSVLSINFFYAWISFSLGAGISIFAALMILLPFKQRKWKTFIHRLTAITYWKALSVSSTALPLESLSFLLYLTQLQ